MENIGKPRYGVVEAGIFGFRVVSGIVTGIKYTEDKPVYEISFGKNSWNTTKIFDNTKDLLDSLNIVSLDRVKETHGLSIIFGGK